jgi:transcription elongation factor S-II
MSPSQWCPEKWKDVLEKKRINEEKENNVSYVDTYTCRKCGAKKSTIRSQQTRSLDEPITYFVTCCNCYNTFIM